MRVLVLDDDPERQKWFAEQLQGDDLTQVWNADAGIKALQGERFDLVFLDHDLCDGPGEMVETHAGLILMARKWGKDGIEVAKAITQLPQEKRPRKVHVHSWNPIGAVRMERLLHDAGIKVTRAEFGKFSISDTVAKSYRVEDKRVPS